MKRNIIILLLILITFPVFCTEISTGLTYDSHQAEFPIGADFSLEETFENNSSLFVGLAYKNEGTYTASIMYKKMLSLFMISGGLNYDISKTGIYPGIAAEAGIVLKKFSFTAAGGANLNYADLLKPESYNCSADIIFDTSESIIDLKFLVNSFNSAVGKTTKIGGGLLFTAYQQGAPATIDFIANAQYVTDTVSGVNGVAANAGMGINVTLPFMSIHLKTLVDVMQPGSKLLLNPPFSIGLSAGFVL